MVTTHIPVVDALNVILKQRNITPSSTLLHGAYDAMIITLKADRSAAFDRNYANGQVEHHREMRRCSNWRGDRRHWGRASTCRSTTCKRPGRAGSGLPLN
jgi:hypothetical protein